MPEGALDADRAAARRDVAPEEVRLVAEGAAHEVPVGRDRRPAAGAHFTRLRKAFKVLHEIVPTVGPVARAADGAVGARVAAFKEERRRVGRASQGLGRVVLGVVACRAARGEAV